MFSFLVGSGASHHAVKYIEFLSDYCEYGISIPVQIAKEGDSSHSYGEGNILMFLKFGKFFHILQLLKVQYIPNIPDNILSVRAFTAQFRSSIILNSNNGFILSRKLHRKLSLIYVMNCIYHLSVYLPEKQEICETPENVPDLIFCDTSKYNFVSVNKISLKNFCSDSRKALKKLTKSQFSY